VFVSIWEQERGGGRRLRIVNSSLITYVDTSEDDDGCTIYFVSGTALRVAADVDEIKKILDEGDEAGRGERRN